MPVLWRLSCLKTRRQPPQMPRFDWRTLKVQGNKSLSQEDLGMLVVASAKGNVGVGRVSALKLL